MNNVWETVAQNVDECIRNRRFLIILMSQKFPLALFSSYDTLFRSQYFLLSLFLSPSQFLFLSIPSSLHLYLSTLSTSLLSLPLSSSFFFVLVVTSSVAWKLSLRVSIQLIRLLYLRYPPVIGDINFFLYNGKMKLSQSEIGHHRIVSNLLYNIMYSNLLSTAFKVILYTVTSEKKFNIIYTNILYSSAQHEKTYKVCM